MLNQAEIKIDLNELAEEMHKEFYKVLNGTIIPRASFRELPFNHKDAWRASAVVALDYAMRKIKFSKEGE